MHSTLAGISMFSKEEQPQNKNGAIKFILDGFAESGFIIDDDCKHVTSLLLECYVDKENPRTEITIKLLK